LEPDLPQVLFHKIGQSQGLIELRGGCQALVFLAAGVEIFGVFEEQPAGPLQGLLVHDVGGFVVEFAPRVREALVIGFDDMEVIKDMDRSGQVSQHGADKGR
jgi:hypothetical protein